jgi:hypothetical protein
LTKPFRKVGAVSLQFQETNMQRDIQIRVVDGWALASDGMQWVVQRQKSDSWEALKFIRSTKDTLEWAMARAGAPRHVREQLINGLPNTFDEWREEAWHDVGKQSPRRSTRQDGPSGMTPSFRAATSVLGDKEAA